MQNDAKAYESDIDASGIRCMKCDRTLVPQRITLRYLGHSFSLMVPCCPVCGQVYISKELAQGKMSEVEMLLEDK